MSVASHVRLTATRRLTAVCIGIWFVALTVLGARHEAQVRHVIDAHGNAVHAQHMHGAHTGDRSDIHEADRGGDGDACDLVAATHRATIASPVISFAELVCIAPTTAITSPVTTHAALRIYRLAPKTSPPAAS